MFRRMVLAVGLAAAISSGPAAAATLYDSGSPTFCCTSGAVNQGRWLAGYVGFGSAVTITGIEHFMSGVGDLRLAIWEANGEKGLPGRMVFDGALSVNQPAGPAWVGLDSLSVDLAAGGYWFGPFVDNSDDFAGSLVGGMSNPTQWSSINLLVPRGDWQPAGGAYGLRVFGEGGGPVTSGKLGIVPEPDTWAMLILGFAGAGATLRKARRALVPA